MTKLSLIKKQFWIAPLQADDSASLHQIHYACFVPYWDKYTFDTFFKDRSIFGYKACFIGKPLQIVGFCLCRLILDEAEVITIAVHPHYRQQGVGYLLMDSILRHLHHERATKLFLEVEENNFSALALYQRFEFKKISKRTAYYQSQNDRTDAIIMQKTFEQID
ncbi:ribosomal protein S18-alanine N-acetyltransferase [Bartonella sp. A05]|uniref:ribosomal protein S18-alanine N-acetyltransferase n=1 Tax=Bartonella sp. A05 TaxID=2967261 RepID=UPI0022A95833|nr:ribosomal protein S18-alanine N-acetyltransferase [Bartonella sp. A05]MCZ2203381.1 ribosomal protein S18-alanine N-acetyltransferase [Bartonella sp. A05]